MIISLISVFSSGLFWGYVFLVLVFPSVFPISLSIFVLNLLRVVYSSHLALPYTSNWHTSDLRFHCNWFPTKGNPSEKTDFVSSSKVLLFHLTGRRPLPHEVTPTWESPGSWSHRYYPVYQKVDILWYHVNGETMTKKTARNKEYISGLNFSTFFSC